jgi:pimeloyl-ACP methyl ester carboxylesterase
MPTLALNGARLHYDLHGDGPETLVFIHGLMLASGSWHHQVEAFADRYRVLTFDLRGQGRSEMTPDGLDLDNLAADAAALIGALVEGPCHLVGFSMGSFVAMRVAARRPELVRTLTLIGPSAEAEEAENLPRYALLIRLVTLFGPGLVIGPLMKILFGDTFLKDPAARPVRAHWRRYLRRLPRSLARAAAASAGRAAITGELASITAPTLVVSGTEDRPVSPAKAQAVADGIDGARFVAIQATGHAVMLERPGAFNRLLADFLEDRP